ncbi:Cna B-type domain-containing protein [Parvimonas sp. C2]|uniref:Cna B-type domain-containing protein n=1 Tax=Parvimonas sp. C2 TaxID=3110692 RepID=UPI002B48CE35|nr:Cna B-type domain-containing protein [Parvimonas sp. C2]MEB3073253.1 Cna B-type domain-containing protein [Parvimonas sp. C2]
MRIYLKDKSKRLFAILLSCLMVVGAILPGMQIFANSKLDLKNVTIKSFDIIDSANGEQKIEYKKQGDEGYDDYLKDPSKFKTVVCQNQKKSNLSLKLEMTYKGTEPIKEGDTLEVPAYIKPFDEATYSAQQLTDNQGNPIGTYEYRNGKFVITFSGDHIKNKKEVSLNLSTPKRTVSNTLYGEGDDIEKTPVYGKLGDKQIIVGYEKKKKSDPTKPGPLSLDNVTIDSFDIIDVTNGNRKIDYRTSDKPDYDKLNNDPSQFTNAICQDQKDVNLKLKLEVSYKGDQAIKEGDTLTIPANYGGTLKNFNSQPLYGGGHQIGTWQYKNGNVEIHFSGEYIKNNQVKSFKAKFETGEMLNLLPQGGKSFTPKDWRISKGKLGKNDLIVAREKEYIAAIKPVDYKQTIYKFNEQQSDKSVMWGIGLHFDIGEKLDEITKKVKYFYTPYLALNNGQYKPGGYTDIYVEDTLYDVIEEPDLLLGWSGVSGINDDGKAISGTFGATIPKNLFNKIDQGTRTKEQVKASLKSGEYCMFKNPDGSYTFMMRWWDMNDSNGFTYDKIPDINSAGGVGNFLKKKYASIYGELKPETITKINEIFKGKSVQNVQFKIQAKYKAAKERTEVPNTAKISTKQTGEKDYSSVGVLTPPAGIADAPADPLSIKLIKADVKTGANLSKDFKFELQTTDDNGKTWKAVEVTKDMLVKGTLNADKTLTPDDKGVIEIKNLKSGKKYRFFEKAHAAGYEDVKEDKDNPNSTKNPRSANSKVIQLNNQGAGKVIVMYNEPKAEKIDIKVTKTWIGPEKESVKVKLLADGKPTGKEVTLNKGNNWTDTFKDLDKLNVNGGAIKYTVEEENVEGYEAKVTGDAKTGFTITNTNVEKTSVNVTKVWEDKDNQDGKRPDTVTVKLFADGKDTGKTITLTKANNWTDSFKDLYKYKDGKKVVYTIKEEKVDNGYITDIIGDAEKGFKVINTRQTEKVSIEGKKTWDDKDNQDGKRPKEITINLLKNGNVVDTKKVTEAEGWKWKFENLDKYENGKEINYSISEEKVDGYTTEVNGYDVKNSYTPGKTSVQVTKAWDDKDNQDGKRPNSVTIKLLADGKETDKTVTLTEANKWTDTFKDLDEYKSGKKIEYTIKEEEVGNGYVTEITGDAEKGYKVTNKRETEKVSIEGSKTWDDKDNQDGKRPKEITINLLKNGNVVDTKKVTEAEGWKWKFENLDKYENGKEINYSISEEKIEGYTTEVKGYDVKNSYTPGKTSVQVTKAWADKDNQDGKRPESVTVQLLADGKETGKTLKLSEDNKWTDTFKDLDEYKAGKKIEYTIKEESLKDGYVSVVTGTVEKGLTVTNTRETEKVSVEGSKTWDDKDNQDGKRPTEITINLLRNGKKVDTKKVTEAEGWKWKFENLDKYENGKEINYTISEEKVEGYTTEVKGYDVKNSYTPGKTSVQVTKAWDDKNDQDKKRPDSVTIKLLADGKETGKTLKLSKDNKWTDTFKDLDEYKDGKKIEYTIKEVEVGNGYKSVITGNVKEGYVVTNVRTPNVLKPRVPKTGLGSSALLYTALLGLSGTVLFSTFRRKRKEENF